MTLPLAWSFLLAFLLSALWQIPFLLAATLLSARLLRPLGPCIQHRLWLASLLLQCTLPAFSVAAPPLPQLHLLGASLPSQGRISILLGPVTTLGATSLLHPLQVGLLSLWAIATLVFTLRFLFGLHALARLRRSAESVHLEPPVTQVWTEVCAALRVRSVPTIAVSPLVGGPLTLGIRRPLILLPPHLLGQLAAPELRALLAHECAHIRRHDFATNLFLQALALPLALHPALTVTRARLLESREWACDAEAAHALAGPRPYAASLLRLATLVLADTPRPAHAVGLFTSSTLERRIMQLAQSPAPCSPRGRLVRLVACTSLAVGTAATALALHMPTNHPIANSSQAIPPAPVSSEVMAGQVLTRVPPVYPPDAKGAKIQGSVRLQALISATGTVEQLRVLSGPSELRRSSLDAVRQWTYKPYTLNGSAVAVQTVITINYSLAP